MYTPPDSPDLLSYSFLTQPESSAAGEFPPFYEDPAFLASYPVSPLPEVVAADDGSSLPPTILIAEGLAGPDPYQPILLSSDDEAPAASRKRGRSASAVDPDDPAGRGVVGRHSRNPSVDAPGGGSGGAAALEALVANTEENLRKDCVVGFPANARWHAYAVLLTYPQNAMKKEEFMERLLSSVDFREVVAMAVVCEEKHKEKPGETNNPGVHLHAYIKFNCQVFKGREAYDQLGGRKGVHCSRVNRGQIHKARTIAYVCKDGNYMAHPVGCEVEYLKIAEEWRRTVAKELKRGKDGGVFEHLAQEIRNGSTPEDICEKYPGRALQHLRKIREYYDTIQALYQSKTEKSGLTEAELRPESDMWHEAYKLIRRWLVLNLVAPTWPVGKRPQRQLNLAIRSHPGAGKSSFVRYLDERFRVYHWPRDQLWHDKWMDGRYDLIICDEFTGSASQVTPFLQWTSGDIINVNRRGLAPVEKRQHVPVIVLSMFTYKEWYKDIEPYQIEALRTRFVHAEIPDEGFGCLMKRLINDGSIVEDEQ